MTYNVKTLEFQNIIDIAIQEYGDVTMVPVILFDNPNSLIDFPVAKGTVFSVRDILPQETEVNAEQLDYFRRKAMTIKTGG